MTLELVSPVLRGAAGLGEVARVLRALAGLGVLRANGSMGLHVHVGVGDLSFESLKKVAMYWLLFEPAIDLLFPKARTGNRWCMSNLPVGDRGALEKAWACLNLDELIVMMNPAGRNHKLNFQNLAKPHDRRTLEFRQHAGTASSEEVSDWVQFLVNWLDGAVRLPSPCALKAGVHPTEKLFEWVVEDQDLHKFCRPRFA
jgi:hypothetical protein